MGNNRKASCFVVILVFSGRAPESAVLSSHVLVEPGERRKAKRKNHLTVSNLTCMQLANWKDEHFSYLTSLKNTQRRQKTWVPFYLPKMDTDS